MKIAQPKAKLAASGQGWAEDFSDGTVKGIGGREVLAALGLVLPALLNVATVLVPWPPQGSSSSWPARPLPTPDAAKKTNVIVNAILGILAAGVAIARFGSYGF
jgi:hypothetical protein